MCNLYTILEQLYDAPIGSNSIPMEKDVKLMEMTGKREEALQKLNDSLSPEQKELIEAFLQIDGAVQKKREFKKFKFGFEFGLLMMAEIMEDYGEMVS